MGLFYVWMEVQVMQVIALVATDPYLTFCKFYMHIYTHMHTKNHKQIWTS